MGDALAALGHKIGLTKADFEVFDQVTDKTPAQPLSFECSFSIPRSFPRQ
jgi:hypothetical protein